MSFSTRSKSCFEDTAGGEALCCENCILKTSRSSSERLKKIFRECVTSYAEAQNIIVIKTLPGLASAACSALDSMRIDTLVGTLAGDDTAFLLMKDNTSADEFFHEIEKLL